MVWHYICCIGNFKNEGTYFIFVSFVIFTNYKCALDI